MICNSHFYLVLHVIISPCGGYDVLAWPRTYGEASSVLSKPSLPKCPPTTLLLVCGQVPSSILLKDILLC